jgi:hypothetical protein
MARIVNKSLEQKLSVERKKSTTGSKKPRALDTREGLPNPLRLVYINQFPWGLEGSKGD